MFGIAMTAILSAGAMILVVLLIRVVAGKHISKMAFMLTWAIITMRLLIPLDFVSRISIWNVINQPELTRQTTTVSRPLFVHQINWFYVLLVIWLIGVVAFGIYFFANHRNFRKSVCDAIPVTNQYVLEWQKSNSTFRKISIKKSDRIESPLTYGIFKPIILLPDIIELYDEEELRNILAHEYVHIRRFDYVTKIVLAITLSIHWFNPLVWLMYFLANRDIELSCDEVVVRTFDKKTSANYAMTLINAADGKRRLAVLYSGFAKHSLEERVEAILASKKKSSLGAAVVITITIVTLFVFAEPIAQAINQFTVGVFPNSNMLTINGETFNLDDHRNESGVPIIVMPGVNVAPEEDD